MGACVPQLASGGPCTQNYECTSGTCLDGADAGTNDAGMTVCM
jgi:hypothetical protein